jgi:hypothetical protein
MNKDQREEEDTPRRVRNADGEREGGEDGNQPSLALRTVLLVAEERKEREWQRENAEKNERK